jgi:signal transduction histidine kinase
MHDEQAPFDPCNAPLRDERLHRFSHALKNRLGSLWQAAAMLHDLPEGPERAQLLAMAEKNYFNGARELEGLMDDFSVPRGISKLHHAPVELKSLLEQCIGNVAFRTEKKNQHVSFQADDAIPWTGIGV